jgi:polyferredoxin
MIWLIIWAVGAVAIFFTPMIMGWEDEIRDGESMAIVFGMAVFWPAALCSLVFTLLFGRIVKALQCAYAWPTRQMNNFWEKRRNERSKHATVPQKPT